jgi:hypothetical protein
MYYAFRLAVLTGAVGCLPVMAQPVTSPVTSQTLLEGLNRRRRWLVNAMSSTLEVGPIGGARETSTALWMANVASRRRVDEVNQSVAPVVAVVTSP